MGNLAIGKMTFQLLGLAVKATAVTAKGVIGAVKVARKVAPHVSPVVRTIVKKIKKRINLPPRETLQRQDFKTVYEQQKKAVSEHPINTAHVPYVVAQTSVLGNFLSEADWQELAADKLDEEELVERLESRYDDEVHGRIRRAAEKVGFVNVRGQVRSGTQQVACYSDNLGHGVRIAIQHTNTTNLGIDMVGYMGSDCEKQQTRMQQALAAEGIVLSEVITKPHEDSDEVGSQMQVSKAEEIEWISQNPQQVETATRRH